jgi:hypothetical protein
METGEEVDITELTVDDIDAMRAAAVLVDGS